MGQLGVASMSRYEGHGADYIDGVRKRTPASCCRLRLFELRRLACGSKVGAARRFFYGTAESRAPSRNCVFPQAVKSGPDTNLMAVIRSCHFHAKIEGVERDTSSPELKPQIIQGRLRFQDP